jgi:RecB family exonuclease
MPAFQISALARKHAPWSFSKMEAAESCPAQFKHKHVLKTAAAPAPSDTKVGIVAHAVLEHRVKGTNAREARRTAETETPLTTQEKESLRMLDESMDAFLVRFERFCKAHSVKEVLCEKDWGFTDTYAPAAFFGQDVFFRGKLDLGAVTADNDLFLIDHKSGVAKPLERDQKKRQQLQAYAVLAAANLPGIAGVRGGINFLQGEPSLRLQFTPYIPIERVRELYVPWLFGRINNAAGCLTEPYEAKPARKWPCGWCQYQEHCPDYQTLLERIRASEG